MRKKNYVRFLFISIYRKYMFCVQLYGKWTSWGHYNLYFEALKGSLLKNVDFCRKYHATIPEHHKVDPIWVLNLKV